MNCETHPRDARAGFSLLEVLVAATVAAIAILALAASISNSMLVTQQNREFALAMEAARAKIEEIQARDFTEAFAAYNQATSDDPASAPGADFAVTGLKVRDNDSDGMVGEVIMPESTAQAGWIDETRTAQVCGSAANLDLNGDGDATDSFDPARNRYGMLPVAIRIEWSGTGGEHSYEVSTVILRR